MPAIRENNNVRSSTTEEVFDFHFTEGIPDANLVREAMKKLTRGSPVSPRVISYIGSNAGTVLKVLTQFCVELQSNLNTFQSAVNALKAEHPYDFDERGRYIGGDTNPACVDSLRKTRKLLAVMNIKVNSDGTMVRSAAVEALHAAMVAVCKNPRGETVEPGEAGFKFVREMDSSIDEFLRNA